MRLSNSVGYLSLDMIGLLWELYFQNLYLLVKMPCSNQHRLFCMGVFFVREQRVRHYNTQWNIKTQSNCTAFKDAPAWSGLGRTAASIKQNCFFWIRTHKHLWHLHKLEVPPEINNTNPVCLTTPVCCVWTQRDEVTIYQKFTTFLSECFRVCFSQILPSASAWCLFACFAKVCL